MILKIKCYLPFLLRLHCIPGSMNVCACAHAISDVIMEDYKKLKAVNQVES